MTHRMADQARQAVFDYLADGEWHGHHEIVTAVRGKTNQHALRETLRKLRNTSELETKSERPSYRHGLTWYYRLPQQG